LTTPEEAPPTVGVKSSRDLALLPERLEDWLSTRAVPGTKPRVSGLVSPSGTGMSTETVLFDAEWTEESGVRRERLVARIPPDPADMPVFPTYDLPRQFKVMTLVRQHTDVPVPEPLWLENDPCVVGQPFMVMRRVEGEVPPDNPLYPFGGNWLFDATAAEQSRLQESTIAAIARLHEAPAGEFAFLQDGVAGDTSLRRLYQKEVLDYYAWVAEDVRSPLLERSLRWLEDRWPSDTGETVLSWGDARIGNVMYRDFEPAAVLDWEMASVGPREVDLAWFQFFHEFFHGVAVKLGMAGMAGFMRRDDVVASYEQLTGHTCRDMDWYGLFAATRFAINALRVGLRSIHFGESTMPGDVDQLLFHASDMEAIMAGTYWEGR
jgi:aminoglycoside phosphotransferase (APT) family kinase protein